MAAFDGVIVGGGHNSLTLGAYMARAGLRVCVLERAPHIGGGCSTEEPILPGFRCNLHSNFYIGFSTAPLMRDFELQRFGFSYIEPAVQHGVALRDGTALVLHRDVERSCASLARFSRHDAAAFRHLHETYAVKMRPFFTAMLYNPPLAPEALRDRLSGPAGREMLAHAPLDLFQVVDKHFEDHRIRTLFKLLMHVTTGENEPGTGLMLPIIMSALTDVALPIGGSLSLPLALARVIEAGGGVVRAGAEVREIVVERGRATGVRLADGTRIEAKRFVASGTDAPATMRMVGEEHFPEPVRQKLKAWHWGNHSLVTLHLALNAPPDYAAARFDPDLNRALNLIFGFDDTDQLIGCFEQCRRGEFPDHLMGNGACNSLFDPTYAPAGKHVAFWWPFAPYALEDGPEGWERRRADYAARLLETWQGYAPNLNKDNVLGSYLYTPRDIPLHDASMVDGAIRMGAYVPSQLGVNRPHPMLAGYRGPVEGLYLCGSSNHGGGANGAPGYNAANVLAEDLKLARSWTPIAPPDYRG
jgi:phytoene dehydrogenase-like protein